MQWRLADNYLGSGFKILILLITISNPNLATTMPELEIKCPQPSRPLKRKGSHLELSADIHEPITKQQILFWPVVRSIDSWIDQVPLPQERRSRSDGLLFHDMGRNASRTYQPESPEAHSRTPAPRAASAQEHRRTDERPPLVHPHLQEPQPNFPPTLHANPTPAPTPTPSALSLTSPGTNQASDVTALRPPTLGVTSPSYRQNLARHQVHIDSMGRNIPDDIRDWSSAILGKQRTSPGLSEDQIKDTQDTLCRLDCENEDGIKETLPTLPIFPPKFSQPSISQGHNGLWNATALPHTSGQGLPPISTPKADRYYGYADTAFDNQEYGLVNHRALRPFAQPGSAASFWPFFMVEFKAPSRAGTLWAAVNQNAGNGAHSLNSIETLRSYSKNSKNINLDNYIFSCVADTTDAALWVHWLDGSRYNMAEVGHFHFARPMELKAFRNSIKNIIDYGVDDRLPMIKDVLKDVAINDLDRIEKAKRTRRPSEAER